MSLKRDAGSMAGKMREYLKSHPGQTTNEIAAGLGWSSKRVSAAVWAEMGRPDSQVVRVELPVDGSRRMPRYSYYHKDNAVVGAKVLKPTHAIRMPPKVPGESPDGSSKEMYRCGNCGGEFHAHELVEPKHLFERLLPGDTMPDGECPRCGAFCHLVETTKPEPKTAAECDVPMSNLDEKPAITLDDFADMLALAIAKRVVSRVQSQLERQLQTILPAVGANATPISIEALTSRLAPVEDTKAKKASVLIAGLLPNQAGVIDTEFGDCFDLRYFMTDDNLRHLKSMAKSVDHVFTFTSKVSHAVEEVMVGQGHKIHRCSGGMTMLKDQLFKLYAEGTV